MSALQRTVGAHDLPDELIGLICHFSRESFPDPPAPGRNLHARRIFEAKFRPPLALLNLRLVTKRFARLATPYAWEFRAVEVGPHSFGRDVEANSRRITASIRRLEEIFSRPDLAAHIKTLSIKIYSFVLNTRLEAECKESIEQVLKVTTSLRAFHINMASLVTARAARFVLTRPTLRALDIHDWAGLGGFDKRYTHDIDLSRLEMLGVSRVDVDRISGFLDCPSKIKHVLLDCFSAWSGDENRLESLKLPWVSSLEELNVSNSYGPIFSHIGREFRVRLSLAFISGTI